MYSIVVILSLIAVSSAIVCTPELCSNAHKQELNCPGKVIKNGGFCGCTDVCAKVI